MESTEHELREEHLAKCLALSNSAQWNQNEADWRLMLGIGRGWGISLADGTLAASTLVLPYGSFAWVSMVLVLPEHRRKGYATQLLRVALADLKNRALTPILDATPAGREVYVQEGFSDTWGFRRLQLNETIAALERSNAVRPLRATDWPELLALDARAFGASRERLLRSLAARLPQTALVAEENGILAGFLLGRDGREARQLGVDEQRQGLENQVPDRVRAGVNGACQIELGCETLSSRPRADDERAPVAREVIDEWHANDPVAVAAEPALGMARRPTGVRQRLHLQRCLGE